MEKPKIRQIYCVSITYVIYGMEEILINFLEAILTVCTYSICCLTKISETKYRNRDLAIISISNSTTSGSIIETIGYSRAMLNRPDLRR